MSNRLTTTLFSLLFSHQVHLGRFSRQLIEMCQPDQTRQQLELMDKQELVRRVLTLQHYCGQLKKQRNDGKSKFSHLLERNAQRAAKVKQKKNPANSPKKSYRYIAIKVAYLGWDLDGLQANSNLPDSVENLLRAALRQSRLVDESDPVMFTRCGRTDKGVSSFDQVMTLCVHSKCEVGGGGKGVDELLEEFNAARTAYFDKQKSQEAVGATADAAAVAEVVESGQKDAAVVAPRAEVVEFDYANILNRILPDEVRVLAWAPVDSVAFSARFDCTGREYRYYFPRGNMSVRLMRAAAVLFCGEHDFRNFGKINVSNCRQYVRRIDSFEKLPCDDGTEVSSSSSSSGSGGSYDMFYAKIQGSGFVYHQVRSMMAVLFLIGLKKEEAAIIPTLLDVSSVQSKPCFGLARGPPLSLYRCTFNTALRWQLSSDTFAKLLDTMTSYWCQLHTKAQMVKELIKCMRENTETRLVHHQQQQKASPGQLLLENGSVPVCPAELSRVIEARGTCQGIIKYMLEDKQSTSFNRYKPILERPRGKRLQDAIDHFESKRMKRAVDSS